MTIFFLCCTHIRYDVLIYCACVCVCVCVYIYIYIYYNKNVIIFMKKQCSN